MRLTLPYAGWVISAGNESIAAGLGTGRFRGIGPKRVISLKVPIMASEADCDLVRPVRRDAYGHPGQVIMRDFTGPRAAEMVETAARLVPAPASGSVARSAAKNMHLLVAGAAILDEVFGSGTDLRDSAVLGAQAYLKEVQEPEHDLDRLMGEIEESQGSWPGGWPSVSEYRETKRAWSEQRQTNLPQHGVDRHIGGVRADDGTWFAVFGHHLRDMLTQVEADEEVALKEAARREWLSIAPKLRKAGKYVTDVYGVAKMYRFNRPFNPGAEGDENPGQTIDPADPQDPAPDEAAGPTCSVCREPMTVIMDGQTTHPMCEAGR
jgi:hypothetical protein